MREKGGTVREKQLIQKKGQSPEQMSRSGTATETMLCENLRQEKMEGEAEAEVYTRGGA